MMDARHKAMPKGSDVNWLQDERAGIWGTVSRFFFSAVFLIVGLLSLASCDNTHDTSKEDYEERAAEDTLIKIASAVSQKVVNIEVVGADSQNISTGSGFFVTGKGTVATCAHLIDGSKSIRVKTLSGAEFEFERVLHLDRKRDLALLSVNADGVSFFEQSGQKPSVGTKIAVFGNPLGLKGSLTDGVVSAVRGEAGETSYLQISAPVSPGSSGSPVVSLSGDLLGMVGARAQDGEGIGFALESGEIWAAVNKPVVKEASQAAYEKALAMSRKRYLPSRELWADPEWNNWKLPKVTSQRLAVLRRLKSKYPDVALLRIEIARALSRDGNDEGAFEECAALISDDPGNRLAVKELIGTIVSKERKAPFLRKAGDADPLNFHLRKHIYEQEESDDDFLSAQIGARQALETAPFSLQISEGYAEALVAYELHELAIEQRSFESIKAERIRLAIKDSNEMRRMVAAASLVVAEPIKANLEAFVVLAEGMPRQALPYAWELNFLGKTKKEIGQLLDAAGGERLRSFCRDTIKNEPLIAETYFLDPGAVNAPREGLLYDAIRDGWFRFMPLGMVQPLDQLGMLFLLADHQADGDSKFSVNGPGSVVDWVETLNAFSETGKALGRIWPRISKYGEGEWQEPLIFQFWLATQKQRFVELLKTEVPTEEEKAEIEAALAALRDIPSLNEAEKAVRAVMMENQPSLWTWGHFGDEYQIPLERAFEAAAAK